MSLVVQTGTSVIAPGLSVTVCGAVGPRRSNVDPSCDIGVIACTCEGPRSVRGQEGDVSLREVVEDYLRTCDFWCEHPEHAGTYMHWEDLRADLNRPAYRTCPTDLAAVREMAYEGTSDAERTRE